MRQVLKKFTRSPAIPHFRIVFPMRRKRQQKLLSAISQIKPTSPALFVSLNGFSQNPVFANTLYDTLKYVTQRKKVPLYTFLQDNIDAFGYYIASAGKEIIANPYCKIGEIGVPVKSYRNIRKLLEYFGVQVDKIGDKGRMIWDPTGYVTEEEKDFTKRWFEVVTQKLKTRLQQSRSIKQQTIPRLSQLLTPKKALSLSLIDKISTLQQYHSLHFPNNRIIEQRFTSRSTNPNFNTKQLQTLVQMNQWMSMPKIALMSMNDPVQQVMNKFVEMVVGRLGDHEKMEDLDEVVGNILATVESEDGGFDVRNILGA